jgi:large conductance mechanosensitive channel
VIKGFKEFLLRGNVVDLAVAVVIGAAFGAVVSALVRDLITPIVAAVFGQPDFSGLDFTINGSRFRYGDFLNALITFVSVAAAVYFFVVVPVNALTSMRKRDAAVRPCPECLTEIPAKATRCRACTAAVAPV